MKIFKYLLLILFLASASTYAQKYRFKTSSFMVSNKDKKGNWGEWSKPEKSKMIVLLDMESHRIVVYSEVIQLFSIIKYGNQETKGDDFGTYGIDRYNRAKEYLYQLRVMN